MNPRVLGALIAGLTAAAVAATPAAGAGPASVTTGQTMTFDVPSSPNGFSQTWTLNYPGDNSNLTIDAELGGYDPSFASAIGFNVFDSQHQAAPLEIATTQSNMKTNDPKGIEFNYSSGTAGAVNFQFFSYASIPLSVSLSQSGLVSINGGNGSTVAPVTLQAQGVAAAAAPAPAALAPTGAKAPAPAAPAPSGTASDLTTGQTLTFNAPASPNGFTKQWTFSYPGDNSNIIFDAEIGGYDPSFATAIGFNVFDSQHQAAPLEVATTQSNMKNLDPHGIEFVYSSGTAGTVIVQYYSYAPAAVTMTLTQSGLIQNAPGAGNTPAVTSVTLQG